MAAAGPALVSGSRCCGTRVATSLPSWSLHPHASRGDWGRRLAKVDLCVWLFRSLQGGCFWWTLTCDSAHKVRMPFPPYDGLLDLSDHDLVGYTAPSSYVHLHHMAARGPWPSGLSYRAPGARLKRLLCCEPQAQGVHCDLPTSTCLSSTPPLFLPLMPPTPWALMNGV